MRPIHNPTGGGKTLTAVVFNMSKIQNETNSQQYL